MNPVFAAAWPVEIFEELDSTSSEAQRRSARGDLGPVWIRAQRQTAGRGRLGRDWVSPTGNFHGTALFPYSGPLESAALACYAAGLAVIDACERLLGRNQGLSLKWPNDVLADGAKVAGVLIETGAGQAAIGQGGKRELWMSIGIGVNLNYAPEITGRPATSLAALANIERIDPADLAPHLDAALRSEIASLLQDGFAPIRLRWLDRAAFMHQRVVTGTPESPILGVMRDLDAEGSLVLELEDGSRRKVRTGEVALATPPPK